MHSRIPARFLGVALLLMAGPALAIDDQGRWWTSVMISGIEDTSRGFKTGLTGYHLGIGRGIGADMGIEYSIVGTRFKNREDEHALTQHGFSIDLTRRLVQSPHFSPYAVLGIGWMDSDYKLGEPDEEGVALSFGIGVTLPTPVRNLRFRTELRARRDLGENLTDYLLSVGTQLAFGAPSLSDPAWTRDSDGDGVPDIRDRCPDTPPGAPVDRYGCRIHEGGTGSGDNR